MNYLKKLRQLFAGKTLRALLACSGPVRTAIILIMLLSVVSSLLSLAVPVVTKQLVDGVTAGQTAVLWSWGAALAVIILSERLLSALDARLRSHNTGHLSQSASTISLWSTFSV